VNKLVRETIDLVLESQGKVRENEFCRVVGTTSSLRATGWRPCVADWSCSAICFLEQTTGPIVCWCGQ